MCLMIRGILCDKHAEECEIRKGQVVFSEIDLKHPLGERNN